MVDLGVLLRAWTEIVLDQVPGVELFDAHTHIGENDPDGMRQSADELLSALERARAKGAFVFPFHEPDGYRTANDAVIAAVSSAEPSSTMTTWRSSIVCAASERRQSSRYGATL